MILSWNEIKDRAIRFSKEWEDGWNEKADAQSFLIDFFNVFGISRRRVATFEHKVKKFGDGKGYIDLLWKGNILIEMKSKGENLEKAYQQAIDYTYGLKDFELPKYILVSDFDRFILNDLEDNSTITFHLSDLVNNVQHFGTMIGYQKRIYQEQDPVNIEAAELMGKLHDQLKEIGYTGHPLEVYLVRLLFCLFADDTTIFEKQQFQDYITQRTRADGSDLAAKLQELFQVLDTPVEKRFKNLDEQLNEFPYINGKLFEEILPTASFDAKMREALLKCCTIDWSKISPAIFGSMFQSVMNPIERRNLGAHYTSEKNILKLIKPLFLDELWSDFEKAKGKKQELQTFHDKLSKLTFLDPACGCGNFLVISYRELRLLELEILRSLNKFGQLEMDISRIIWLDVDQFYGIEYEEFPGRIAEVAMWLIDHQMNMLVSQEFGQYFVRLPLKKSAHIIIGNALQIDWTRLPESEAVDIKADTTNVIMVSEPEIHYKTVNVFSKKVQIIEGALPKFFICKTTFDYVLGNPPFVGKKEQNLSQKFDMRKVFSGVKGFGVLDYVTAWYVKAAQLIANTQTKVAFVSTNSITQGEQVGILWNLLFNHYNIKIHFAHRTFKWSNEARGNAAVHVVIIGFANYNANNKKIFEYGDIKGEPHEIKVKNINPYLVEGKDFFLLSRTQPICNVPELSFGNMANDNGNLILQSEEEYQNYILHEPQGKKYIKRFVGSVELINNIKRYCFWLVDANPSEIKHLPILYERIKSVQEHRQKSSREATRKLALTPALFGEIRQKKGKILVIPRVSSENRFYIPMEYYDYDTIINDRCTFMQNATLYHFGILTSAMHMFWMRTVCGRLKSDYNYSNNIVYNNFPWPETPTEKQIQTIEEKAQKVLDARAQFPDSSLADLYDPRTMPPILVKAHQELDKAVDLAYRPQPFPNDAKRMEFLFDLYEKYVGNLFATKKRKITTGI